MLLTVYGFQHLGGLAPCPLCVTQRYPHYAVLALGLAGLIVPVGWVRYVMIAAGLAYLVGAGYGVYHVGVEQGWFQSSCATPMGATSIEELRAQIFDAPLTRCDEVPWTLIGVSFAGWNAIVSFLLGGACLFVAIKFWMSGGWPRKTRNVR
jgi:disulfide bond formation protein DsbB